MDILDNLQNLEQELQKVVEKVQELFMCKDCTCIRVKHRGRENREREDYKTMRKMQKGTNTKGSTKTLRH